MYKAKRKLLKIDKTFYTKRYGLFVSGILEDITVTVKFGIDYVEIECPDKTKFECEVKGTRCNQEKFTFCLGQKLQTEEIPLGSILLLIEEQNFK